MSTPAKAPQDITTPPWAKRRSYFDLLLGASCVILIISNIAATKGIEFGPLPFELPPFTNGNFIPSDGGFFLYPLAYVLGDVLSEVYGFKRARRAKTGTQIVFGEDGRLTATVVSEGDHGGRIIEFSYEGVFLEILESLGQMPLPPYIKERLEDADC